MWNPTAPFSAQAWTLARGHDLARQQAHALRDPAIDDFWRGANAALTRALPGAEAQARRSARRLHARLQRRHLPA